MYPGITWRTNLTITSGKAKNAAELTHNIMEMKNKSISHQTVRWSLKRVGLRAVVKKKKPSLTAKQKKDRYHFARVHKHWTNDDWKRVVWSDEIKINRLWWGGRFWTWKEKGQGLVEREVTENLKFGGSHIRIWGCMLWGGKEKMCKICVKMDQHLYTEILEENLLQTLVEYDKTLEFIIFMQDNDPKRTSKKAKIGSEIIPSPYYPSLLISRPESHRKSLVPYQEKAERLPSATHRDSGTLGKDSRAISIV